MKTQPRTASGAAIVGVATSGQSFLSVEELAEVAGISVASLQHLVRRGLIEPPEGEPRFPAEAARRLRLMLRLQRDLGVNLAGAEIIVDLLERLDRLERELSRLDRG
jgi:DNA-binding transcriptional MerR regulator